MKNADAALNASKGDLQKKQMLQVVENEKIDILDFCTVVFDLIFRNLFSIDKYL